jgi:hypothetical protein
MRDLRDPQILGGWLLNKAQEQKSTCRRVYDANRVARDHIADVSGDDSMQRVAQVEYAETLKGLK